MPFKIDIPRSSVWQPWHCLERLNPVSNNFRGCHGCHTDSLSVSVYGGLIIYILTLAGLNVQKTHFLTWVWLKWTKASIFTITWKMVNTCVIRMLFDSYNTLTNKFISNLVFIAFTELATVTYHLSPYRCWFQWSISRWMLLRKNTNIAKCLLLN